MTGIRKWTASLSLLALAAAVLGIFVRPASRTKTAFVPIRPLAVAPSAPIETQVAKSASEFQLFETGTPSLAVQYALPPVVPASVRLGPEDQKSGVEESTAFASDWAVIAGRIPRIAFEGSYPLPLFVSALADSAGLLLQVSRLFDSAAQTEGFAIFRPDATFDVSRALPLVAPASTGFSLGLKYRWVF